MSLQFSSQIHFDTSTENFSKVERKNRVEASAKKSEAYKAYFDMSLKDQRKIR